MKKKRNMHKDYTNNELLIPTLKPKFTRFGTGSLINSIEDL
jgi:hypothetical protein